MGSGSSSDMGSGSSTAPSTASAASTSSICTCSKAVCDASVASCTGVGRVVECSIKAVRDDYYRRKEQQLHLERKENIILAFVTLMLFLIGYLLGRDPAIKLLN